MRRVIQGYVVDEADPRAPSQEIWDRMTEAERAFVVASLPCDFPVSEAHPPEGEPHFDAMTETRDVLRRHFGRIGRSTYVACDLPVYYPAEPMFSPDVIAVLDADLRQRDHWIVTAEG